MNDQIENVTELLGISPTEAKAGLEMFFKLQDEQHTEAI